ncbi:Regulator of G-protein signaling 19 [Amphibalanus amphitrite]|uniref:Regulator of G-protein signaling 19 n=1 Tax=Amphibalanus amphitrite TaxID=1232801 RepID=A0A6A4XGU5_AMPAM|nr:Regulator of G-protein signaling 19 [Amphibalanus amphitrite]
MNCFECLKSRTDSPDHLKAQPAPVSSAPAAGPGQTVVGIERASGGVSQPKRQAKFAYLEEVLKSQKGMVALREYMATVQQEHVLDFLEDVRRYRSESDAAARAKSAQTIFSSYLAVCAERELSLDKPVRDAVVAGLSEAPPHLFDAAERSQLEELRRDVFPRFLKTPLFERLAGLA